MQYNIWIIQWIINEYPWMDDNKRLVWIYDALIFAADQGELEMIQFIHERLVGLVGSEANATATLVFSPAVMEAAAANGHLSIARRLHHHEFPCTPDAMDKAAKGGHLHVVQWLHENRSEGCSTSAMGFAAGHGHFSIVKWLHENRSEGCIIAEKGHLEIVQWLHENHLRAAPQTQ